MQIEELIQKLRPVLGEKTGLSRLPRTSPMWSIRWAGCATAHIFTYSRSWQRHLEGKLGLHPEMDNGHGGRSYELDKKLIRLPQPKRRLSEATRQRLADNLATTRKGNLSVKNRSAQAKSAEKSGGK